MARKKPPPPIPLRPLPIRIVRLHAKLAIAAVGRRWSSTALAPRDWRWPTRLLIGWDVGVALYLGADLRHDVALPTSNASAGAPPSRTKAPSPFWC